MPVYLCQSGSGHTEPWRYGIQVYASPFLIQEEQQQQQQQQQQNENNKNKHGDNATDATVAAGGGGRDLIIATFVSPTTTTTTSSSTGAQSLTQSQPSSSSSAPSSAPPPPPIRRVRHAEVVLVDDVCIAHNRYWLRLRWPGHRGGFAGYVAMAKVPDFIMENHNNNNSSNNKTLLASAAKATNPSTASSLILKQSLRLGKKKSTNNNNNAGRGEGDFEESVNIKSAHDEEDEEEELDEEEEYDEEEDVPDEEGDNNHRRLTSSSTTLSEPMDNKSNNNATTITSASALNATNAATTTSLVMTCLRTGLDFPSSQALKLLSFYDDGVTPPVATLTPPFSSSAAAAAALGCTTTTTSSEPVFCRICREGLHDDVDDEQPAAADDDREDAAATARAAARGGGGATAGAGTRRGGGAGERVVRDPSNHSTQSSVMDENDLLYEQESSGHLRDDSSNNNNNDIMGSSSLSSRGMILINNNNNVNYKGPVQPHPTYAPNAEALQNPLLAPCECSGSMAFVHYLCVEQWRCRSRHPDAQLGKNCETCGSAYSLPPPLERPAHANPNNNNQMDQEDWLEAMPPHVMQALRHPHLCWQIGAALVRRRWLRPLAPIFTSPIVALYCRARRLLKKRGVARRRWSCSLCRRRARWKCVRCLRSYYCSRQCQNVSWHIVHKHVCYKPSRFCQSVVAYSALSLAMFPGILQDPFMYDLGLCLIPASFVVMGILGGGVALVAKKLWGVDIRGRALEFIVVLLTILLSLTSWGLVQGFFGMPEKCYGLVRFASFSSSSAAAAGAVKLESHDSPRLLRLVSAVLLRPAELAYSMLDKLPQQSAFLAKTVCARSQITSGDGGSSDGGGADANEIIVAYGGCFQHLPTSDFYLEPGGQTCANDLIFVSYLYLLAYVVFVGSAAWKHQDRMRRQRGAGGGRAAAAAAAAAAQQQQQNRFGQQQQQRQENARPHQD